MKALLIAELAFLLLACMQSDFARPGAARFFVPMMLLAGSCFFMAVRRCPPVLGWGTMWGAAIVLRIAMLGCEPCDDFWRFAWEGRVQNAAQNPYVLSPEAPELASLRDDTWPRINHPESPAIYPPLAEITFSAITLFAHTPIAFKLVFIAADLLTLALLLRLVPARDAAWYAWNPAVIYTFAGAAHYDSLMLLALTAAIVALDRAGCEVAVGTAVPAVRSADEIREAEQSRDACAVRTAGDSRPYRLRLPAAALSAIALGVAIAFKVVPIFLLPVWAFALGRRAWLLGVTLAIPAALTLPFGGPGVVLGPVQAFADVTRFNELLVWIFPNPWQRNWPVTTLLCFTVAGLAWHFRRDWRRGALWCFGATLILSPVLHPWYVTWILPLAVWQRAHAWTVLSLSALAALLLWETTPFWIAWQPNLITRALVILPPLAALFIHSRFKPDEPAHG